MFPERFFWIFSRAHCLASLVCTFPGSWRMVPLFVILQIFFGSFPHTTMALQCCHWSMSIPCQGNLPSSYLIIITVMPLPLCNASAPSCCSWRNGGLNNLSRLYAMLAAVFAVVATTLFTLLSWALRLSQITLACCKWLITSVTSSLKVGWGFFVPTKWWMPLYTMIIQMAEMSNPVSSILGNNICASSAFISCHQHVAVLELFVGITTATGI